MNNRAYGIFDFDTFFMYFIDDVPEKNSMKSRIEFSNEFDLSKMVTSSYAATGHEAYDLYHLHSIEELIHDDIFHETVHWWQAISSPVTILRFLAYAKRLRNLAPKYGLYLNRMSNTLFDIEDNDVDNILYVYNSSLMNFEQVSDRSAWMKNAREIYTEMKEQGMINSWEDFIKSIKEKIELREGKSIYSIVTGTNGAHLNIFKDDPPTAMPMYEEMHKTNGKVFYGYTGLLDYFNFVNFTGDNIIEVLAYLNQYLIKGNKIPEYNIKDEEDNMYLGIWEFYKRMHAERYENEQDLILSFFALSDLALMTDHFSQHEEYEFDESLRMENVSLPYRYGTIIYRAQGFKPFKVENGDIANSIKNYQDDFCGYCGMFSPENGIKGTILHLINVIIRDLVIYYNFDNIQNILDRLNEIYKDKNTNWHYIEYIISEINMAYTDGNVKKVSMHHFMITVMVNALLFRLDNRGEMAVPYLFKDKLSSNLQSPFIIYNGKYYMNIHSEYYNSASLKYTDIGRYSQFDLLVSKSLVNDNTFKCGFLNSFIKCWYQSEGFGCPLLTLSESEQKCRNQYYLGDWCHWRRFVNELQITSPPYPKE